MPLSDCFISRIIIYECRKVISPPTSSAYNSDLVCETVCLFRSFLQIINKRNCLQQRGELFFLKNGMPFDSTITATREIRIYFWNYIRVGKECKNWITFFSVCGFSCESRDEISNGGLWRTWKNYVPARRRPIQFVRVFLSTKLAKNTRLWNIIRPQYV